MFFRWAQGYNGGKIGYIDKDVICYQAGSNIKFIAEDGAETVFNFKGNGVGPFAVHATNKCFAVAERCLNPKITVYVYPTFREAAVLKGIIILFTLIFTYQDGCNWIIMLFYVKKKKNNNVTKYHENILNNDIKKKFDFLIEIFSFTMVD